MPQVLHPLLVHFPIALLFTSLALDLGAWRWPMLRSSAWPVLLLGTIGALAATITGLIDHEPFEQVVALQGPIQTHQMLGMATTLVFIGLTAWRGFGLRRGRDISFGAPYLAAVVCGLALLTLTGLRGGELVYQFGLNVEQIIAPR